MIYKLEILYHGYFPVWSARCELRVIRRISHFESTANYLETLVFYVGAETWDIRVIEVKISEYPKTRFMESLGALRIARAYPTVSKGTILVIEGIIPSDFLALERKWSKILQLSSRDKRRYQNDRTSGPLNVWVYDRKYW